MCVWGSSDAAQATQTVRISARFAPQRLGAHTTATLGFEVLVPSGEIPSPLTGIDFRYPADLGIATSGLGLATCAPALIEAHGPGVCPSNSHMGTGRALVKFAIGPEIYVETAQLSLLAGPSQNGYVKLLVAAIGRSPVAARIVMSTLLLPGELQVAVPLVPSVPNGPNVAVVRVRITIGGKLSYHERSHGKLVTYHPKGLELPRRCPPGGFRFTARFSFLDGTHSSARTVVRCPRGRH